MTKRMIFFAAAAAVAVPAIAYAQGGIGTGAIPAPAPSGGVINIGQAFSTVLAPYIDAAVQALILGGVTWFASWLRTKFKFELDQKNRDALTTFLQNQAGSLLAAGAVKMNGLTVHVDSSMLALAANQAITRIPDAAKHFGLTPDVLAKKIVEMIPQVPAGAQLIAQSHMQPDNGQPVLP